MSSHTQVDTITKKTPIEKATHEVRHMASPLYPGTKNLLLVVGAILILQLSTATEGAGNSSLAKLGCRDSCGNVSIPYPFGIGKGCFMEGFEVHCSLDNISTLDTSGTPLLEINLTFGEARIQNYIARNCDSKFGPDMTALLPVRRSFMVSRTKNIFTAIGCSTIAFISGDVKTPIEEDGGKNKFYSVNACGTFCEEDSVDSSTDCSGRGCCQSSIPRNLKWFVPAFLQNSNSSPQSFSPCSYAFVAELDWFKFYPSYVSYLPEYLFGFGPPMVLDWVFGSATCAAKRDASSYPCPATKSVCIDVPRGHRCSCSPGYEGNPYLAEGCQDINECDSPSLYPCHGKCTNTDGGYICSCPARTRSRDPKSIPCAAVIGLSISIGVGSAASFIVLVLIALFIIRRMKHRRAIKLKQKFFKQNRGQLLQQLVSQRADIAERMIITVDELQKATNNFDKARELGGGGHGTVYKGMMSDLQVVAIKKSNITVRREINEFINEVAILSQINHRNVVRLLGCCMETEVPLLVYEFISNGTLYHHLHEGPRSLSWANRLRIAAETASALAYLHSSVSIPIIHRDIKSTNILLDDTMTSKISDFGASRYVPMDKSGLTTMVQGTIGYLDPMYFYTGRLTDKSDVYSFGVLLVELLTKKKTFTYISSQGEGLVADFANLHGAGNLVQILDPQVIEEGGKEVQEFAQLAASCIKIRGEDRPNMKQVNRSLEGILSPEKCVDCGV